VIATTCTHLPAVCHGPAPTTGAPRGPARAWALALLLAACAPTRGWERDTARVCADDGPAVVCVQARPDRPVEFDVGGATLLPGECAVAPTKGGALRVAWSVAGGPWEDRRVRAGAHRRTELALGADGELRVTARLACDPGMPPFHPLP